MAEIVYHGKYVIVLGEDNKVWDDGVARVVGFWDDKYEASKYAEDNYNLEYVWEVVPVELI